MKHIIILGDGMADHPVERLGGKTLLQYAHTPYMDMLAKKGKTGRLITVPDGFLPGSEVANSSIMGYDQNEVYEGRGPLEAASIGYDLKPTDLALRCNIINVQDGKIITHNGGNLETEDADVLIKYLNETLGKDYPDVEFVTGIQYRHLLVVHHGNKHIECAPPHDHPNENWHELLVKPILPESEMEEGHISSSDTAALLNELIIKSKELLENHPFNIERKKRGERMANLIWPWGGGYRPHMLTLSQMYPQIKKGSVISAVDLIRGIGHYAGLRNIIVEGATGLSDTNYEGKAAAAIQALKDGDDFVYVHVEASDEAGHDGDLELKLKTIEYLDQRLIKPIVDEVSTWTEPVCISVLPDHPTPVEVRTHVKEPVPFLIYYPGIEPDQVEEYDEVSCVSGSYGLLQLQDLDNKPLFQCCRQPCALRILCVPNDILHRFAAGQASRQVRVAANKAAFIRIRDDFQRIGQGHILFKRFHDESPHFQQYCEPLRHQIIPSAFIIAGVMGGVKKKTRFNAKFRRRKDIPHPPGGILYIRISSQSSPAFPPSPFPPSAGGSRRRGRSPLPAPACAGSGCTGDRGSCCP